MTHVVGVINCSCSVALSWRREQVGVYVGECQFCQEVDNNYMYQIRSTDNDNDGIDVDVVDCAYLKHFCSLLELREVFGTFL